MVLLVHPKDHHIIVNSYDSLGTVREWHPSIAETRLGSFWLEKASVRIKAIPCES